MHDVLTDRVVLHCLDEDRAAQFGLVLDIGLHDGMLALAAVKRRDEGFGVDHDGDNALLLAVHNGGNGAGHAPTAGSALADFFAGADVNGLKFHAL